MIKATILALALLCESAWASTPADWSELVTQVKPAVVHINAYQQKPILSKAWDIPGVRRTWITDLFDKLQAWLDNSTKNGNMSEGAGYFYDSSGMILTVAHVVDGADQVWITLADRRRLEARIIGVDLASDVAVLEVKGGGQFPSLPLANLQQVRVGEPVLAIGSPLGFAHSVSAGIISAVREDNYLSRNTFLQTDTPLTHGNSGGVLVDTSGRAVGISAYGHDGKFVSFLVPVYRALKIANYLVKNQLPPRGCVPIFREK